jgi:hypothetical protein
MICRHNLIIGIRSSEKLKYQRLLERSFSVLQTRENYLVDSVEVVRGLQAVDLAIISCKFDGAYFVTNRR